MQVFFLIAGAHFLALISPGQDFFLLVRTALRGGFSEGARASAGIALANALWIAFAVWGVSRARAWEGVLVWLKIGGAGLLVYMGWHFLRARPFDMRSLDGGNAGRSARAGARPFLMGMLSALGNPKNGLFYTGLFSLGVAADTPLSVELGYGAWMVFAVFAWDLLIVRFITHPPVRGWLAGWQHRIEQAAGVALIGIGVALLVRG